VAEVLTYLLFAAVGALIGWTACSTRHEAQELRKMQEEETGG
jgi:hypothetical protein